MRGRLGVALLAGLASCGPGDGPDPESERTEQVASLARSLEEARAEQVLLSAALDEALGIRITWVDPAPDGRLDTHAFIATEGRHAAHMFKTAKERLLRKRSRESSRKQG